MKSGYFRNLVNAEKSLAPINYVIANRFHNESFRIPS